LLDVGGAGSRLAMLFEMERTVVLHAKKMTNGFVHAPINSVADSTNNLTASGQNASSCCVGSRCLFLVERSVGATLLLFG